MLGLYREAEKVAREAAVGTLSVKDLPKRKEATQGSALHKAAFGSWMRSTLGSKVRNCLATALAKMLEPVLARCAEYGP